MRKVGSGCLVSSVPLIVGVYSRTGCRKCLSAKPLRFVGFAMFGLAGSNQALQLSGAGGVGHAERPVERALGASSLLPMRADIVPIRANGKSVLPVFDCLNLSSNRLSRESL